MGGAQTHAQPGHTLGDASHLGAGDHTARAQARARDLARASASEAERGTRDILAIKQTMLMSAHECGTHESEALNRLSVEATEWAAEAEEASTQASAFSAVQRWVRGRESDLSSADVKLSVQARCSVRCGMLVASQ